MNGPAFCTCAKPTTISSCKSDSKQASQILIARWQCRRRPHSFSSSPSSRRLRYKASVRDGTKNQPVYLPSERSDSLPLFLVPFTTLYILCAKAFRQPAISNPLLRSSACFSSTRPSYSFLPGALNELLCYVNTIFLSILDSPGGVVVADQFARLVFPLCAIISYESFRYQEEEEAQRPDTGGGWTKPGFLAIRGGSVLAFSQLVTGAIGMPIYFAAASSARQRSLVKGKKEKRPSPEAVWTVLISSLVGYLLPAYYVARSEWSYGSLGIWQLYPLYVILLNNILPPLIRSVLPPGASAVKPIAIIQFLSIYLSATAHISLINAKLPWSSIFLYAPTTAGSLAQESHAFFTWDYLLVALASISYVATLYRGNVLVAGAATTALSCLAGPGAGVAAVWANREMNLEEDGKAKVIGADY